MSKTTSFKLEPYVECIIAKEKDPKVAQLYQFINDRKEGINSPSPNILFNGDKYYFDPENYKEFLTLTNAADNNLISIKEVQQQTRNGAEIHTGFCMHFTCESEAFLKSYPIATKLIRLVRNVLFDSLELSEGFNVNIYALACENIQAVGVEKLRIIAPEICISAKTKLYIMGRIANLLCGKEMGRIRPEISLAPISLYRQADFKFIQEGNLWAAHTYFLENDTIEGGNSNYPEANVSEALSIGEKENIFIKSKYAEKIAAIEVPTEEDYNDPSEVETWETVKRLIMLIDEKNPDGRYNDVILCSLSATSVKDEVKGLARWFYKYKKIPNFESDWSNKMREDCGIYTIYRLAKSADKDKYKEIKKSGAKSLLNKYIADNEGLIMDRKVSEVLYHLLAEKYVSTFNSVGKRCWYKFLSRSDVEAEKYKWKLLQSGTAVRNYISTKLPRFYDEIKNGYNVREKNEETEHTAKLLKKIGNSIFKSKMNLSRLPFINNVENNALDVFELGKFASRLDSYENVLGVGNGVLVMGEECQFISGPHNYLISKYTPTRYVEYSKTNPYVVDLKKALKAMIPEKDAFQFIMMHGATGLDFRVHNLLFMGFGGGSNGKSSWAQLMENTLGGYCSRLRMTLLTDPPESSDKPNSARMMLKGRTWGYFDETDKNKKLNTNSLKALVGVGGQSSRELHKSEEIIKNTASFFASSNYEFIIDEIDHGTWRRILVYIFSMRFCENPTGKYECKVNSDFILKWVKDPNYLSAMLSILVHYYEKLQKKYKGDLTKAVGPTIAKYTREYRNRQDTVNRFITECLEEKEGCDALNTHIIAEEYIRWYRRYITEGKTLDKRSVISEIENSAIGSKLKRSENGSVYKELIGYKLKQTDDDKKMEL